MLTDILFSLEDGTFGYVDSQHYILIAEYLAKCAVQWAEEEGNPQILLDLRNNLGEENFNKMMAPSGSHPKSINGVLDLYVLDKKYRNGEITEEDLRKQLSILKNEIGSMSAFKPENEDNILGESIGSHAVTTSMIGGTATYLINQYVVNLDISKHNGTDTLDANSDLVLGFVNSTLEVDDKLIGDTLVITTGLSVGTGVVLAGAPVVIAGGKYVLSTAAAQGALKVADGLGTVEDVLGCAGGNYASCGMIIIPRALEKGAVLVKNGAGKIIGKIIKKDGEDVLTKLSDADVEDYNYQQVRKYWTNDPVDVYGKKVYTRDDLFDPNQKFKTRINGKEVWETNTERMQRGVAPKDKNGDSINLHHMGQRDDGTIVELTKDFHQGNTKIIHINNGSSLPSGIDRNEFERWKKNYWKNRANDFTN